MLFSDYLPSPVKRAIKSWLPGSKREGNDARFYENVDYLDGYVAHTNSRVAEDPKQAIGGKWEEIGSLQFEFLKEMGLQPDNRMLDIGCGTLSGGRHFIGYLNPSNYTGIDIAPACLDAGRALIEREGLAEKHPRLVLNTQKRMTFSEFDGEQFDFLLAQSVFTHLAEPTIAECFENIGRCMDAKSSFFFTFSDADTPAQTGLKDFRYPWAYFENLAHSQGFVCDNLSDRYDHPRGQKMGWIRRK